MKISLCTPAAYAELKALYDDHPDLRLQNDGCEYLDPAVREAKAEQLARIEEILAARVVGFLKFHNFKTRRDGRIRLRFDYDWGAEGASMRFTGVGYLDLDELLHGFKEGASQG